MGGLGRRDTDDDRSAGGDPDRFLLEVTPAGGHGNQVLAFDGGKCRTLVDPARFDPSGNSWVGKWDLSPDGRRLAVQITDAAEATRLWVLDRDTGDVVDGPIDLLPLHQHRLVTG
ncbi:hypothetical protein ACU686_34700 [Yinghuangia aomiensis]